MGKDRGQQGGARQPKTCGRRGEKEQTEEKMRPEGQARKFEKLVKNNNPSDSMNTVRKIKRSERILVGSSGTHLSTHVKAELNL